VLALVYADAIGDSLPIADAKRHKRGLKTGSAKKSKKSLAAIPQSALNGCGEVPPPLGAGLGDQLSVSASAPYHGAGTVALGLWAD
jgi:hypothetical protein